MNCVGPSDEGQMALIRVGIDHFDLALFHVEKAIRRFARPGEKGPRRIGADFSRSEQRLDVRCGQRSTLHLAQISANRFHAS